MFRCTNTSVNGLWMGQWTQTSRPRRDQVFQKFFSFETALQYLDELNIQISCTAAVFIYSGLFLTLMGLV